MILFLRAQAGHSCYHSIYVYSCMVCMKDVPISYGAGSWYAAALGSLCQMKGTTRKNLTIVSKWAARTSEVGALGAGVQALKQVEGELDSLK